MICPDNHGRLGWRPVQGYAFARQTGLAPIAADELPQLAQDVPVVFQKLGAQWQAVAVLGPVPMVNLQVEADGNWRGSFVPGILRTYPFQLSDNSDALAFWGGYRPDELGAEGLEPVFVEGQLSPTLATTLAFLKELQKGIERLHVPLSWLEGRDVLRPWRVPDVVDASDIPQHTDLFAIDRGALEALGEADWFESRDEVSVSALLPLFHAHLSSLEHAKHFKAQAWETVSAAIRPKEPETHAPEAGAFLAAIARDYHGSG